MKQKRLEELFYRYIDQRSTAQEEHELMQLLADPSLEEERKKLVQECYDRLPEKFRMTDARADAMFRHILGEKAPVVVMPPPKKISRMIRYSAAVVILIALGIGAYFQLLHKRTGGSITEQKSEVRSKHAIQPGTNTAVLTLANGSKITLDSTTQGTLAQQGNVQVVKLANGQLAYHTDGTRTHEVLYNTMTTPRGGQYQLRLPDGTHVWLNAASGITYPTAFTGNERKIKLTGEAYFEVAKNPKQPFKVVVNDMEVEVLGTHFNVMAYDDESTIRTTLVEGKVKVSQGSGSVQVLPSQQAVLEKNNRRLSVGAGDVEEAIAWKNGLFQFHEADILTIMKQLSRWYNVEVEVSGPLPQGHYSGSFRRQSAITQILNMLELPGDLQFIVEGKKVIIKAK